jgi:hypothetical protein
LAVVTWLLVGTTGVAGQTQEPDEKLTRRAAPGPNIRTSNWRSYAALDMNANKFYFLKNKDVSKDYYKSMDFEEDSKPIP